jgi:sugar (pentulose or hexulose) kinase
VEHPVSAKTHLSYSQQNCIQEVCESIEEIATEVMGIGSSCQAEAAALYGNEHQYYMNRILLFY